ncbi:MAG: hypothetical protein Ct9H300mP6_11760 [Gammaproteobacteria bacterium]|nr:MAG: hypothetical protein Ct9H300mP6_11760 [Gammaproteobacteria bacterium]
MEVFSNHMNLNVIRVDAEEIFLEKLKGVEDPEGKNEKSLAIPLLKFSKSRARKLIMLNGWLRGQFILM